MPFVVETGGGLSSANSYLSVEDFKSYHADRGNSGYAAYSDAEIQGALIIAADYIDRRYTYVGVRRNSRDQALAWPRISAVDVDGYTISSSSLPREVTNSAAELAFKQLSTSLFQDIDFDSSGGAVIEATDAVGSVRRTRRYSDSGQGSPIAWKTFPEADSLLWRVSVQKSLTLVRA